MLPRALSKAEPGLKPSTVHLRPAGRVRAGWDHRCAGPAHHRRVDPRPGRHLAQIVTGKSRPRSACRRVKTRRPSAPGAEAPPGRRRQRIEPPETPGRFTLRPDRSLIQTGPPRQDRQDSVRQGPSPMRPLAAPFGGRDLSEDIPELGRAVSRWHGHGRRACGRRFPYAC